MGGIRHFLRRERLRRMLRLMSMRLRALAALSVTLTGCASGGGEVLGPPQAAGERAAVSTGATTPTPYPWTDCNAIRAGDALDYSKTQCDYEVTKFFTVDCVNGTYVHLSRPEFGDLEGIDGVTPWREAAPLKPERGMTSWAFQNCKEHE